MATKKKTKMRSRKANKGFLPRIEIIKFLGKSGGFAAFKTVRYRAELVGAGGRMELSEAYGMSAETYARDEANEYAEILKCPIITVDKTKGLTYAE